MALYGGAASRTPLLGPKFRSVKPYTRTITYPGGVNPYYKSPYAGVLSGMSRAAEGARQANIARQKRIESLYGEMMARYQPGGAFERRGLANIERQKRRGVGREMQQMISSGLYGTTTAAGAGRRWEADVGARARLTLEDIMQQRLTGIQQLKAGFLERIQEPYPDYRLLMSMLG